MDWDRLVVRVKDPAEGTIALGSRFNVRGQKYLPLLPPGSYSLLIVNLAGEVIRFPPPAKPAVGGAGGFAPGKKTEASMPRETNVPSAGFGEPRVYQSLDRTITAVLRLIAAGVEVAFETTVPALANRKVAFAFIEVDANQVALNGEAILEQMKDDAARWEGVSGKVRQEFPNPASLSSGSCPRGMYHLERGL